MNVIKKANVKDKNRVRERFILHNEVSMAEANDDSRLVTCVVDDREYKTGALIRLGINFFTFAMNVEALYKVNLTPDLAARYKGDLSRSIDPIVQKSKDLKNLFRSCFPPDFTSDDEPIIWKAYDITLVSMVRCEQTTIHSHSKLCLVQTADPILRMISLHDRL